MKHTQTGFQSTQTLGPRSQYIAILHGTCVVQCLRSEEGSGLIMFNSGGYHTRSTVKAINGALKELGLDNKFKAFIKCETIYVECTHLNQTEELNDFAQFLLT